MITKSESVVLILFRHCKVKNSPAFASVSVLTELSWVNMSVLWLITISIFSQQEKAVVSLWIKWTKFKNEWDQKGLHATFALLFYPQENNKKKIQKTKHQ